MALFEKRLEMNLSKKKKSSGKIGVQKRSGFFFLIPHLIKGVLSLAKDRKEA